MGLRDRLSTVRDYILASFVPAPDHPGRGGMTGETGDDGEGIDDSESVADEDNESEA